MANRRLTLEFSVNMGNASPPTAAQPSLARQILDAYAIEGMALLGDGVAPADVEAAAARLGTTAGPLAAADQVSISYFDEVLHRLEGGHGHSHAAGHDHGHAHQHDHEHDHGHGHDHGQAHDHDHGHEHEHEHGHAHEHGHGHDHDHGQAHAEPHRHDQSHEGAHAHGQHGPRDPHGHDDGHGHDDEHDHSHEHAQSPASAAKQPVSATDALALAASRRAERKAREAALEAVFPKSAVYVLEKMSHGFKRSGGKGAPGFYDGRSEADAPLWSGLSVFSRGGKTLDAAEIDDRLRLSIALTLLRAVDADQTPPIEASTNVLPLAEAGALIHIETVKSWINADGPAAFEARARDLAGRYGPRFDPPAALVTLAASGKPLA